MRSWVASTLRTVIEISDVQNLQLYTQIDATKTSPSDPSHGVWKLVCHTCRLTQWSALWWCTARSC